MRDAFVADDSLTSFAQAPTLHFISLQNNVEVMGLCQTLDALFHCLDVDRTNPEIPRSF